MSFKKYLLSFAVMSSAVAAAEALKTYNDSVAALNKFIVENPELRTFDDKKCYVNIQSEWKAEAQKFKLSVQLTSADTGEIGSFSIDTISIAEMYQTHVLLSHSPLHLNVINYVSDGFGHWADNSKQLRLSPYSIRIFDMDPTTGEPLGQVACTLPDLPLDLRKL